MRSGRGFPSPRDVYKRQGSWVAARAQARIDASVREEGVALQEARSRTDAEVMGKVQLGSIADLAAAFERRLEQG